MSILSKIVAPFTWRSRSLAERENKLEQRAKVIKGFMNNSRFFGFSRDDVTYPETSISQQLQYFSDVSPVFNAINLLSDEFSCIPPKVWDTENGIFLDDHPVLDLFKKPSADDTQVEFFKELAADKGITGNIFLVATGRVTRPPLEITSVQPDLVGIKQDADGRVGRFDVSHFGDMQFTRQENRTGLHYYHEDQAELWHIRNFNPKRFENPYGMSDLNPVYREILQHLHSNLHNLGMLKNGARPSGLLSSEQQLVEDQVRQIHELAKTQLEGTRNAGRVMVLPNGMKYSEMGQSNKEMDFLKLLMHLEVSIYLTLKIPLALVIPERMTLSNLQEAKSLLYRNAVLPMAKTIFSELTRFLMPRYPNSEHLEIRFSEAEIPALQEERNKAIKTKKETGVATVNELRVDLGLDPLEGGDVIYAPSNLEPILGGTVEDETKPTAIGEDEEDSELDELSEKQFISIAKSQLPDKTESELAAIYKKVLQKPVN